MTFPWLEVVGHLADVVTILGVPLLAASTWQLAREIRRERAERKVSSSRFPTRIARAFRRFSKGPLGHVKHRSIVSIAVRPDDDFNVLIEFHEKAQKPFNRKLP